MFTSYTDVRDWLENFIPFTYSKKNLGLARIKYLLKLLGNPQDKFKSIHVAGTSGKGSTAFYIARLLEFAGPAACFPRPTSSLRKDRGSELKMSLDAAGARRGPPTRVTRKFDLSLKVGLHLSPHLVDIRERMQVNGKPIPVDSLIRLIGRIRPIVETMKTSKVGYPSYFEILVAASFLYFAKMQVDWAVVEVGLGGRLDATNVLQPKLCVITNVGLDHTDILGKSIEKIAYEKAGIIKSNTKQETRNRKHETGGLVITGATGKALEVIRNVAKEKKAPLIKVNTQSPEKVSKSDPFGNITKYIDLFNHTPQKFALANGLLAISALSACGIRLKTQTIKKAFSVGFPGRFEEIEPGVVLDGAHNPDKIRALIEWIKKNYLETFRGNGNEASIVKGLRQTSPKDETSIVTDKRKTIILVVAFKKGKQWQKMLDLLLKELPVKRVIATKFYGVTDTGKFGAVEPEKIANYLDAKYKILNTKYNNSQEAVFEAMNETGNLPCRQAGKKQETRNLVLITGSLYLVGEVRTLWHLPNF